VITYIYICDIYYIHRYHSAGSSTGIWICCAVVVAVCPGVAGVSVCWPPRKQSVKRTLSCEDLKVVCKFNVILNMEYLVIKTWTE